MAFQNLLGCDVCSLVKSHRTRHDLERRDVSGVTQIGTDPKIRPSFASPMYTIRYFYLNDVKLVSNELGALHLTSVRGNDNRKQSVRRATGVLCSLQLGNFAPTNSPSAAERGAGHEARKSLGQFELSSPADSICKSCQPVRFPCPKAPMMSPVVSYHYPCPDGVFAALAAHLKFEETGAHPVWLPNTVYSPRQLQDLRLQVKRRCIHQMLPIQQHCSCLAGNADAVYAGLCRACWLCESCC